ncbi:2,5-diketo-D-gluconate reductase A [Aurantimicrobium minutum]|uniref:aldo/keto reductase n=1 Tax=Aurantimicrobium minutum TaxID=708131 RepID=UPI00247501E7|nr:aldo/keto reductase [Aurantimicrobium minutum]MDH6532687.1 2,5-diketo-D-gluconate reductase A [Aurantimicrobium minutum]
MTIPSLTLNDGLELPAIGLGTYKLTGQDGIDSIVSALHAGYRLIDSATLYGNEVEVGQAIVESGIPREEIIVTTKLPGSGHGFDETMAAFESSRRALGLDVIDLYLIHWPNPSVNRYLDSWEAMVELQQDGLARSIGVCNFTEEFLNRIIDASGVVPSVNQIELHPYFPQAQMRAVHAQLGIQTESWSPLGKDDKIRQEQLITDLAAKKNITPAQLILQWHVQLGTIPLPKSADPDRQRSNLDCFDHTLSDEEMASISSLERGRLWGGDPNTHEEL